MHFRAITCCAEGDRFIQPFSMSLLTSCVRIEISGCFAINMQPQQWMRDIKDTIVTSKLDSQYEIHRTNTEVLSDDATEACSYKLRIVSTSTE